MKDSKTFAFSEPVELNGKKLTESGIATNVQTNITAPGAGFQIFGTRIEKAIKILKGEPAGSD
jgi:hypothetical protein